MATISLRCKACDGLLEVDENNRVLFCPYCGAKELVEESDDVKKERIRAEAQVSVELGRQETEKQINKDRLDAEAEEDERKKKTVSWMLVFYAFLIIVAGIMFLVTRP